MNFICRHVLLCTELEFWQEIVSLCSDASSFPIALKRFKGVQTV
jgi:hypothetical protein